MINPSTIVTTKLTSRELQNRARWKALQLAYAAVLVKVYEAGKMREFLDYLKCQEDHYA